ncbi:hypothetical protein HYY75_05135, partial [bacterium]|nr:hypothetical protein [bacterium]
MLFYLIVVGGVIALLIVVAFFHLGPKKENPGFNVQAIRDRIVSEANLGKEKELVPIAKNLAVQEEMILGDVTLLEAV